MKTAPLHLPGINGLRALAALSVLWGHCFRKTFGDWGIEGCKIPFIDDGVTLFFVISGFLITYLLVSEKDVSGTVSIPRFYMRRILRIWPIYFLYIGVCAIVLAITGQPQDLLNGSLWAYCLFVGNVPFALGVGLWPIVHYWSIGVEEQFYLFWPWVVRGRKHNLLKVAILLGSSWLVIKYLILFLCGHSPLYRFVAATRFDCMMLGAVGAIVYFQKRELFNSIADNKLVTSMAWLLLLASGLYSQWIPAPVRPQYYAVLSLLVVASQLSSTSFWINLEHRFFDYIGKISYGIYVIHPILIYVLSRLYLSISVSLSEPLQVVCIYILTTFVTILIAGLSYRFFEKPFLQLKNRYAVIETRPSM